MSIPSENVGVLENALENARIQTLFLEKQMAERLSTDRRRHLPHPPDDSRRSQASCRKLAAEIEEHQHSAAYALKKVVE
jgi:phosphotransferase system, enzyme I, PtsP